MIHCILFCICTVVVADTITTNPSTVKEDYRVKIAVNGVIGLGLGAGAWLYHRKSDDAYADYCASNTTAVALKNWDRVQRYDVMRNICFAGSLFFLIRTAYYSIKQGSLPEVSNSGPDIDFTIDNQAGFSVKLSARL